MNQQAGWRKSSYPQGQNACVEVTTAVRGQVSIRDTKLGPTSPTLTVTTAHGTPCSPPSAPATSTPDAPPTPSFTSWLLGPRWTAIA